METFIAITILALISFCSFFFYARKALQVLRSSPTNLSTDRFGMPDAIMASLLGLFFVSIIIEGWGKPQTISIQAIWAGSILYLSIIICILGLLIFRNINPIALFGLRPPEWPKMLARTLGWLSVAYPLIVITQAISYKIQSIDVLPQEIVSYLMHAKNWNDRLVIIVLAVIIAPLAEEFIFRGYLYGVLRKYSGRIIATLMSSLLFALVHLHIPSIAGLFVLAIVLTLVYERTSTLWAPIFMHATFNAVSVCLALVWKQ